MVNRLKKAYQEFEKFSGGGNPKTLQTDLRPTPPPVFIILTEVLNNSINFIRPMWFLLRKGSTKRFQEPIKEFP